MNAKAAGAATVCRGFRFTANCDEFLYAVETLRTPANVCFQCGFEFDRGNDDAREARGQRQIERMMGHAPARVSAALARHSERMVNARFPDRAGYGFEMVDLRESRFAGRSKPG
jgi:hypothetical protein